MPAGAGCADNVIDLLEWRAHRHPETVPADALAELESAARVYEALLAQGHELRFDLPDAGDGGGRVRAELRSVDGDVVRPVPLAEIVGFDPPAA
jgi:hypothetical protein